MVVKRTQHKIGVPTEIPELHSVNLYFGSNARQLSQGLSSIPNAAGLVTGVKLSRPYQVEQLTLAATPIEIDEANDYGSVKLADLPTSNLVILGALVDIVCTVDGVVITDPEDLDYAIGTVALTSIDFSNAGEKNVCPEKNVAAAGVMQNVTTATEQNAVLTKGTNALYLNIQAAIATTAIQTFAGTITLFYVDLGAES